MGDLEKKEKESISTIAPIIKWGILGCAEIALKVGRSILLSEGNVITAVASRNAEKANNFLNTLMGTKNIYKNKCDKENIKILDYYKILDKSLVDVVYVPLPSKIHAEWVCRAAESHIHILCKKPAAVNCDDLKKMIQACKTNNVQFMDGVMYMHNKRTDKLLEMISDRLFGSPNRVTAVFTTSAYESLRQHGDIRLKSDGDPLGCLGDLGWYCVRMGMLIFNFKCPKKVWCRADSMTENDIPTDITGEVFWRFEDISIGAKNEEKNGDSGGKITPILSFQASFIRPFRQWVEILGDRKRIYIDDFVLPKFEHQSQIYYESFGPKAVIDNETAIASALSKYDVIDSVQERRMIERMSNIVRKMKKGGELEEYWFDVAYKTQVVCDALMKSIRLGGQMVDVEAF